MKLIEGLSKFRCILILFDVQINLTLDKILNIYILWNGGITYIWEKSFTQID
jgi:hypothetical protein